MTPSRPERSGLDRRFQQVATGFWFAVQRLVRRGDEPPMTTADFYPHGDDGPPSDSGDDYGSTGSGVPRRPAPSGGSASAAAKAQDELPKPGDISGH